MTSRRKHHNFISLVLLVLVLTIPACSRKSRPELKPLKNRSSNGILNRYNDKVFTYDFLSMRVSADVKGPDGSQGFKANLRMAHDSIIWMSISPLMGLEMVRLSMTPDTVKYVSKVPGNRHYFIGTYAQLSSITQSDFDFYMVQAALVGNAVQLDEDNDRFASRIDGRNYVLLSRYNRRLKRVMGTDLKEIEPGDSLEIDIDDRRYQRIIRRSDEEDLLMKRYWIDGDIFRPTKTVFDDFYSQRFLQIEHSQHKEAKGMLYPQKTVITATSPEGTARFSIDVTRIKHYDELDFPFDIPDDYERKYLP